MYFYLLCRLIQIDSIVLAYCFTNTAFLLFQVKTAFIDVRDQRDGLGEIDVDGFVLGDLLVEWIRILDGAVFHTGCTTGALALYNIPGLSGQGNRKVSCFPVYPVNLSVRQDLYVGIPADLDQFGREYSGGAVVGRKGLVKLGHMAANGRRLVDQVNLETCRGKIKGSLNTTDPSTDDHDISKMAVCEASKKPLDLCI